MPEDIGMTVYEMTRQLLKCDVIPVCESRLVSGITPKPMTKPTLFMADDVVAADRWRGSKPSQQGLETEAAGAV